MKNKAYIYPITARFKEEIENPYLNHFIRSLEPDFVFLNKNKPSRTGFVDFIKYLFRVRFIFLNWIEDLPDKKAGIIQSLIFFILILFYRLMGGKVVWTVHNKLSHYKQRIWWKQKIFMFLCRQADFILVHAREGKEWLQQFHPVGRILLIHHPVISRPALQTNDKKWDLFIWGTIAPYKGIDRFLEFLKKNDIRLKVKITGKILNPEYRMRIFEYQGDNVSIEDRYASIEEIQSLAASSEFVLFPYHKESILSSGALTDTLGFRVKVIGPHSGIFAELAEQHLLFTFRDYKDIPKIVENHRNDKVPEALIKYVDDNSWENLGKKVSKWLLKEG